MCTCTLLSIIILIFKFYNRFSEELIFLGIFNKDCPLSLCSFLFTFIFTNSGFHVILNPPQILWFLIHGNGSFIPYAGRNSYPPEWRNFNVIKEQIFTHNYCGADYGIPFIHFCNSVCTSAGCFQHRICSLKFLFQNNENRR